MKIEQYLALSKNELRDELARMGLAQRAKFDAQLAMLCAVRADTREVKKSPAFMLASGKIVEPNRQTMTCRGSVCRAPRKNVK